MTRLSFAEVRTIVENKGYEVEKVSGGYKSQGHKFKNLTDLKSWAQGLPVAEKEQVILEASVAFDDTEAVVTRFDTWDRQGLYSYMNSLKLDTDAIFETKDGWVFDRQKAIAALVKAEQIADESYHDDSQEQCNEPGEIDNPITAAMHVDGYMINGEAWIDIYENDCLVESTPLFVYDCQQTDTNDAWENAWQVWDRVWQSVTVAAESGKGAINRVLNICNTLPQKWQILAGVLVRDQYLEKLQASCHSFAEMVKVTRLLDKLVKS